ncbi:MAG: DUF2933 domain-containing protein [Candidatus Tectomicrobia bacterium]|uniref:DUF2933 domain-containing protein n=1 Tax=Tectimicrobiota bacterium TaxID=2528274 RepID=A0A932GQN5_UNCTE|nr:DUF2933 domain-containing protein [Candidatus Tectomicrobia bacterium]
MWEFLKDNGLWIALVGVFVVMHLFGAGCCGGHRKRSETEGKEDPPGTKEGAPQVGKTGSCH